MTKFRELSFKLRGLVAGLVTVSLMTGCATFNKIAPYPKDEKPVTVSVGDASLAGMSEMPFGAYYDKPHRIVVTGYQKGMMTSAVLFSVVGVLVADSVNKSVGEDKFGADSGKMSTDLLKITQDALTDELKAHPIPAVRAVVPTSGDLVVTPFAVLTINKTGTARLYVMLKAEIAGPDGAFKWAVRYFARAPGEYPVEGKDGWSASDRFAIGANFAIHRDIAVLLEDVQGHLVNAHKVKAEGQYVFLGSDFKLPFILVSENKDYVVGHLAVGDGWTLGGTHILDRADYTFVDADFSTP